MNVGFLLELAACATLTYVIVLLVLIRIQRLIIFRTFCVDRPRPVSDRFKPTHVVLDTPDGEKLDAIWAPFEGEAVAAILYLHGNATDLRRRASRIEALNEIGFSILAIDWRGFGESTGSPTQAGLQIDAEVALAWLARRADLSRIVVLAESLGTGVAVELATKHDFGALVLEAPFFSMVDLAQSYLPFFPIRALIRDPLRSDLWIGEIRTHLLIQHGGRDRVVPFRQGERLYAIAPQPKRFIAYPRGGHNDLPEKHGSYRDLEAFVVERLSREGRGERQPAL